MLESAVDRANEQLVVNSGSLWKAWEDSSWPGAKMQEQLKAVTNVKFLDSEDELLLVFMRPNRVTTTASVSPSSLFEH